MNHLTMGTEVETNVQWICEREVSHEVSEHHGRRGTSDNIYALESGVGCRYLSRRRKMVLEFHKTYVYLRTPRDWIRYFGREWGGRSVFRNEYVNHNKNRNSAT